jgi:hypothetical protein
MNPRYLYLLFFVLLAACTSTPPAAHAPAPVTAVCTERADDAASPRACSHVLGDLYIENTRHTDLSILSNVRSVSGTLFIGANARLTSLSGLEGLSSVGRVVLLNNPELRDVSALSNLAEARAITIIGNPRLVALSGPKALEHLDGLVIANNPGLIHVDGFSRLFTAGDLVIANNPGLIRMSGLATLTFVEQLYLENNPRLAPTPKLFKSLATVQTELWIGECPGLRVSDVLEPLRAQSVARARTATTATW